MTHQPPADHPHPGQPLPSDGRSGGPGPYPDGGTPQHGASYGAPTARPQPGSGLAVAALVLGIAALLLAFLPLVGLIGVLLGAAAIVCGILALRRRQSTGMSVAGIVTGALGFVGSALMTLIIVTLTAAVEESASAVASPGLSSSAAASTSGGLDSTGDPSATHDVELIGSVDGGSARVSYAVGGSASTDDITAGSLSVTDQATTGEFLAVAVVKDFAAQGEATVSCEIIVDGTSVAQETGDESASCSAGYGDY